MTKSLHTSARSITALTLTTVLTVSSCSGDRPSPTTTSETQSAISSTTPGHGQLTRPKAFRTEVLSQLAAHRADSQALEPISAGLAEIADGTVRVFDQHAGQVLAQAETTSTGDVGLAMTPAGLWQSTNGLAVLRNSSTLTESRHVSVSGPVRGLCFDGTRLVQSEGTTRLVLRTADTFSELGRINVRAQEWGTARLGDLACVDADARPQVWAVVAGTDWLIRIDLESGDVTAVADLTPVTVAENPTGPDQVITGVAAISRAGHELWLSGKHYRYRYHIRLRMRP